MDYKFPVNAYQPVGSEENVNSYPPRRVKNDGDNEAPGDGAIVSDWEEINGFRVRLILHPGPPTPERKTFFRQILEKADRLAKES